MSGIVNQPPLADMPRPARKVAVGQLTDGSITTAKLANNAVDETKLKDALIGDFTEVVVLSGDSILLGDATDSGNTKRDTVAGILDITGFQFVSTTAISLASTVSVFGLASGFDYSFVLEAFVPVDNDEELWMRWSDDGSTYEAGASDYAWVSDIGTGTLIRDAADAQMKLAGTQGFGDDASTFNTCEVVLINPGGTSEPTTAMWSGWLFDQNTTQLIKSFQGGGYFLQGTDAIQGVQFLWEGGSNFAAQGDFTIWRRRRS